MATIDRDNELLRKLQKVKEYRIAARAHSDYKVCSLSNTFILLTFIYIT